MSFRTPPTPPVPAVVAAIPRMPKVVPLPQSRRVAAALPVHLHPPVAAVRVQGRRGTPLQLLLHRRMSGLAEVMAAVATQNGHLPPVHLLLLLLRLVAGEVVAAVAAGAVAVAVLLVDRLAEVVAVVEAVVRMTISTLPKRRSSESYSPPTRLCLLSSQRCQALDSGG